MMGIDRSDVVIGAGAAVSLALLTLDGYSVVIVPEWAKGWLAAFVVVVPFIIATEVLRWLLRKTRTYRVHIEPRLIWAREWYFDFWRRRTPDWMFKMWLRTGVMDEASYRAFQERGIIKDDLDPKYIERDRSREST